MRSKAHLVCAAVTSSDVNARINDDANVVAFVVERTPPVCGARTFATVLEWACFQPGTPANKAFETYLVPHAAKVYLVIVIPAVMEREARIAAAKARLAVMPTCQEADFPISCAGRVFYLNCTTERDVAERAAALRQEYRAMDKLVAELSKSVSSTQN